MGQETQAEKPIHEKEQLLFAKIDTVLAGYEISIRPSVVKPIGSLAVDAPTDQL